MVATLANIAQAINLSNRCTLETNVTMCVNCTRIKKKFFLRMALLMHSIVQEGH